MHVSGPIYYAAILLDHVMSVLLSHKAADWKQKFLEKPKLMQMFPKAGVTRVPMYGSDRIEADGHILFCSNVS